MLEPAFTSAVYMRWPPVGLAMLELLLLVFQKGWWHLLLALSDTHDAATRLLETTFQCDVVSARDFCEADDRWSRAVQLLDVSDRAGWELLAAMLNPEWRLRPTAESTLVHRFLSSAIFESSNM